MVSIRPRLRILFFAVFLFLTTFLWIARADDGEGKPGWLKKWADKSAQSDASSGDTLTPVAGVRGLDEPGKSIDTRARDYAAVDRMEKINISDAELAAFVKEGGLE